MPGTASGVIGLLTAGLAAAVLVSGCQPAEVAQPRRSLKVLMHPAYVSRGGATLQHALQKAIPELQIQVNEEERETAVVAAVHGGDADVAFALADLSYLAYLGQWDGPPLDRLRGIATLNTSPLYVLVRGDSGIRSLDDLRGRRVNLGQPGSSTAFTLEIVLQALGGDIRKSYEPFQESLAKLADGRVDATFVIDGYPLESVREALAGGARLVALSETTTRGLRREHPFVRPVVIPRGVYGEGAIPTMGIERLLICRDGLDEELAYRVTKVFFEALPELSASDRQLRQMDVENAPATPVPLHGGAGRYYREQEQM
jgi:TRAP transporter TAXI family solute receptor